MKFNRTPSHTLRVDFELLESLKAGVSLVNLDPKRTERLTIQEATREAINLWLEWRRKRNGSMKLFLIKQVEECRYDMFDAAIVCAPDELMARKIGYDSVLRISFEQVTAEYIGDAKEGMEQGVILVG